MYLKKFLKILLKIVLKQMGHLVIFNRKLSWWDLDLEGVYAWRDGRSLEMASGHSLQILSSKQLHPHLPSYFTQFYILTFAIQFIPYSVLLFQILFSFILET